MTVPFIGGIFVYNFFPYFPVSIITGCILTVIFLLLRASIHSHKKIPKLWTLNPKLILFIFAFGLIYTFIRQENISPIELPQKKVQVEGTVVSIPEISYEKARFTLDNVSIEGRPIKGKIRLSAPPEMLRHDGLSVSYGDKVRTFTRLREPYFLLNPGVYFHDLRKDGVIASGYVKQVEVVSEGRGILVWLWRKRQALARIIEGSISEESASFHKAIVLGLQSGITPQMRDAFTATGVAHLLSVSGTHFALLAFILFKGIKALSKSLPMRILTKMTLYITPTQIAIVLTMPVLIFYALLSGASTPTIRSFIMVFIYMTALFLGRKGQWLNSLSIAAIIILLWEPGALFDLSFQLSFIAVLAIGYALENTKDSNSIFLGGIKKSILITIAATVGTAPFVVYYFHQFPLISPISNLIITPLVCFVVLPLGLFAGFFALLVNINPLPLSYPIEAITSLSLNLIKIASNIPYSNLYLHKPSIMIVALFFLSLAFFIKGRAGWRLLPLAFVLCLYILSPFLSANNSLRITFLDVGQGDSAVIELPDKKTMLIDGGSEDYDTGRRVIAPYLWSKGIKSVDYVVLSHPHPDHYGGLIYIIEHFRVGEVWWNGRKIPEAERFFQMISERKIPSRSLQRGDMLERRDYKIYVLHPYDGFYTESPRGEISNQNNDSLVLKIECSGATALFPGDIEIEAEEDLIHLGKWLTSNIIKIPHHGGKTSSSMEFLKAVSPQIAVISAGRNNPFNHPHKEALDRYSTIGARVFRTDRDGAVIVTLKDKGYEIKTYWDSRFKKTRNLRDETRNILLLL